MTRDEMKQMLRQRPFQPFRVHVADGRVYDVRFPRMNLVADSFMKIGIPDPEYPSETVCHHTEYVRLDQIVRVEPLPKPTPYP